MFGRFLRFVFICVSSAFFLCGDAWAFPGGAIGIMAAAQRAQSPAMVDPAVYKFDTDPRNCSESGEAAAANAMAQLRTDVRYINPAVCNIRPATNSEVAKFASVGTFASAAKFGSAEVISNPDLGLNNGQVIVTNIHCFEDAKGNLPALGKNGLLKKGQFSFKAAGCDETVNAARVCPSSNGSDYRTHKTDDYAFVVLEKPACPAATARALKFTEFPLSQLQYLQGPDSLTEVDSYNPKDVCRSRGKGSARRYYLPEVAMGGIDDRSLFVSQGPIVSVDADPTSAVFGFRADDLKGSSGGAVVANVTSENPAMVGLNVGEDKISPTNTAIRINSQMIQDLKDCLSRK